MAKVTRLPRSPRPLATLGPGARKGDSPDLAGVTKAKFPSSFLTAAQNSPHAQGVGLGVTHKMSPSLHSNSAPNTGRCGKSSHGDPQSQDAGPSAGSESWGSSHSSVLHRAETGKQTVPEGRCPPVGAALQTCSGSLGHGRGCGVLFFPFIRSPKHPSPYEHIDIKTAAL